MDDSKINYVSETDPWEIFHYIWLGPQMSIREIVKSLMVLRISRVICVRNKMAVAQRWCGVVIQFLTQTMTQYVECCFHPRIFDTTETYLGSTLSVVYSPNVQLTVHRPLSHVGSKQRGQKNATTFDSRCIYVPLVCNHLIIKRNEDLNVPRFVLQLF